MAKLCLDQITHAWSINFSTGRKNVLKTKNELAYAKFCRTFKTKTYYSVGTTIQPFGFIFHRENLPNSYYLYYTLTTSNEIDIILSDNLTKLNNTDIIIGSGKENTKNISIVSTTGAAKLARKFR